MTELEIVKEICKFRCTGICKVDVENPHRTLLALEEEGLMSYETAIEISEVVRQSNADKFMIEKTAEGIKYYIF